MKIKDFFLNYNFDVPIVKPFIIAEAGVNHEGSMELAHRLINEAAEAGADSIKFQSYKAEFIASKNSPSYWDLSKEPTTSQYQLFKKYDKFWKKEYEELKKTCDKVNIEFLSTPFDVESATFLNDLMAAYKVSSSDITNKPFIEFVCQFQKPIILSTGSSNMSEIHEAVDWIEKKGNLLSLLHCILNYPTVDDNANLGMITHLRKEFPNKIIGYSDHTLPQNMGNLKTAVLLGAAIIEKHFTFDKSLPGNDHYHAMDKEDLKLFRKEIDYLFKTLGSFHKLSLPSEELSRQNARRSLVALKPIKKGDVIDTSHITWKRPGTGISPKDTDKIVGKTASMDIEEDTVLRFDMFK